MTRPPVRWAHTDLPEELSRLIASAAPSQQDAAALDRMRERLHVSLGPTFESKLSGANPASHVLSLLQRGKWLCAAALATAGLSFVSVQSLRPASGEPSAASSMQAASRATTAPEVAVQSASREATGATSQQPTAAVNALQTNAASHPVVDVPRAQARRASAGRVSAAHGGPEREQGSVRSDHVTKASAGPEQGRGSPRPGQAASARPERGQGSTRPDHFAKASAGSERGGAANDAANSGAPTGLAAELRGLAEIRHVLQSSPTRALALAEAQGAQFSQGALGPERELLRIEALIRAGRADEAKRRAARALGASNNPPYRERIEKLFAQTASPRLAADGVAKQVTRE